MSKRLKKIFYNFDKKEINEEYVKHKTLEELITEKDKEHDYISINIPIIISCVGTISSIILTINPKISEICPNLNIYLSGFLILFVIWIGKVLDNIEKNNETTKKNIEIYDKEIFNRLQSGKDEIMTLLEDIRDNIKHKTKK